MKQKNIYGMITWMNQVRRAGNSGEIGMVE
jgi:hypothetical protein